MSRKIIQEALTAVSAIEYMCNFEDNEIYDEDIDTILHDDLKSLIPSMSKRGKFMKAFKQIQHPMSEPPLKKRKLNQPKPSSPLPLPLPPPMNQNNNNNSNNNRHNHIRPSHTEQIENKIENNHGIVSSGNHCTNQYENVQNKNVAYGNDKYVWITTQCQRDYTRLNLINEKEGITSCDAINEWLFNEKMTIDQILSGWYSPVLEKQQQKFVRNISDSYKIALKEFEKILGLKNFSLRDKLYFLKLGKKGMLMENILFLVILFGRIAQKDSILIMLSKYNSIEDVLSGIDRNKWELLESMYKGNSLKHDLYLVSVKVNCVLKWFDCYDTLDLRIGYLAYLEQKLLEKLKNYQGFMGCYKCKVCNDRFVEKTKKKNQIAEQLKLLEQHEDMIIHKSRLNK